MNRRFTKYLILLIAVAFVFTGVCSVEAKSKSKSDTELSPSEKRRKFRKLSKQQRKRKKLKHAVLEDTGVSTAEELEDTKPVSDTFAFTALDHGRFYHNDKLNHSPKGGRDGVQWAADSDIFVSKYKACPICFINPVTEADYMLEEAIANYVASIVEFRYRRLRSDTVQARLNRIGKTFIPYLDRHHLNFMFTPLQSSMEKNAISAGNGFIYFTDSLLDVFESDEEVAAVLAHEISHAEFRHVLEDFKLSQKIGMISAIAGIIVSRAVNLGGVFQILQNYAMTIVMNGFSRGFELEADAGARWLLESSGWDTGAMRVVLMKLEDLGRFRQDERETMMRSHPEERDRIAAYDAVQVFNTKIDSGVLSMRLKFQRQRVVGWFKDRPVPAIYATVYNNSDSAILVYNMEAEYMADNRPDLKKIEVRPAELYIPRHSYAQIKIIMIARKEMKTKPTFIEFRCLARNPEAPKRKKKDGGPLFDKYKFLFDLKNEKK